MAGRGPVMLRSTRAERKNHPQWREASTVPLQREGSGSDAPCESVAACHTLTEVARQVPSGALTGEPEIIGLLIPKTYNPVME